MTNVSGAISALSLPYALEPILVGSVAKDTYLKNPDIDLFVMFPMSVPVDELRKVGLELGYKVLPGGEERYAEHPYIFGAFEGFDTDIVPCYKLNSMEDRMTAVDRTPFHTKYIIEHLSADQRDQVRLFKQFIKGIGVYGAEIQVLGFSGYLCELLILKYGTFLDLLSGSSNWPDELVLRLDKDSGEEFTKKAQLSKRLANKFRSEPLVFIDPVDDSRNVASALSRENLKLFITAATSYLTAPRAEYFFPKPVKPMTAVQLKAKLKTNPNTILGLAFDTPELVPDILHGQLRKSLKGIQRLLASEGFGVIHAKYFSDHDTLLLFELETAKLPELETHAGPPEGHKNVKDFLSKWNSAAATKGKPYLKDKRWYVELHREFTTPIEMLKGKIGEISLGKHVANAMLADVRLYQDLDIISAGFEPQLTQFLSRKYPWQY